MPSFNQGQYIEESIRAILLQGYPNIEFIIIDGGSNDGTSEIIEKYKSYISHYVSEPDNGQSHAINKGFAQATGDIYYWINSDDFPGKNVFGHVAEDFNRLPQVEVLYGPCYYSYEIGNVKDLVTPIEFSLDKLLISNYICQPSTFFRSELLSLIHI